MFAQSDKFLTLKEGLLSTMFDAVEKSQKHSPTDHAVIERTRVIKRGDAPWGFKYECWIEPILPPKRRLFMQSSEISFSDLGAV